MRQKIILSLFLALTLLFQTGTFGEAFGHAETPTQFGHDKYPDITITIHVEEIEISPKWRETWGSEVVTSYAIWQDHHPESFKQGNLKTDIPENNEDAGIMHKGHGYGNGKYISTTTFGLSGWSWQPNGLAKVSPAAMVYQHFTCSPADYLYFHVKMIEDDSFYKAVSPILGVVSIGAGVVSIVASGGTVLAAGAVGIAATGTDTLMTIATLTHDEKKDEMGHALITIPSSNLVPEKTFSQWFPVGDAKIKLKISTTKGSILAPGQCKMPEPILVTPKSQVSDGTKIKLGQDLNQVPKSEGTKTSFNYDHFKPQLHGLINSSSEALVSMAGSPDFVVEAELPDKIKKELGLMTQDEFDSISVDELNQFAELTPNEIKSKGLIPLTDTEAFEEFVASKTQGFEKEIVFSDSEIKQLRAEQSAEVLQIVNDNFDGIGEILSTPDQLHTLQNEAIALKNDNQFIESLEKYDDALTFYENWISSEGLDQPWAFPDAVYPTESIIPSWIKQSADWWSQGIVSDREFATSLGFLVKEKIIKVNDVEINSEGSVAISDGVSIPEWIRTNAQWWVVGSISDEDFKQGIQFMIKEKLIDFAEKKISYQPNSSLTQKDFEDFVQLQSNLVVGSIIALEHLLELQIFLTSSFDDSAKIAWNQYAEDNTVEKMNQATQLEEQARFFKDESLKTVKTLKDSQEKSKLFFENAKKSGFDDFVLMKNAESEFLTDAPSKIHTINDFNNAENSLKNVEKLIKNSMKRAEFFGGIQIGDLPENGESQSSRYSFSFSSNQVDDSTSKYHGIDSLRWANTCSADSVCDSAKGESCTVRGGDAQGQCIPTWFGIEHFLPLLSDSNDDSTGDVSGTAEQATHQISVIMKSGGYFPIAQFSTWQWEGECDDATHYHSNSGHAVSATLQTMGDPDPNECGYGKISQLPISVISMSDADVQGFIELTNIDPRNNEAMFGGSGP